MATKPKPTEPVILNVTKTVKAGLTNFLQNICRVSIGDTALESGKGQWVTATDYATLITNVSSETYAWCSSFFAKNSNGRAYILECEPPTPADPPDPLAPTSSSLLKAYIESGEERMYMYSLPVEMYTGLATDAALIALVKSYISFDASQYFTFDIPKDDDVSSPTSMFKNIKGLKSVMGIRLSTESTESVSGVLCGIVSSFLYKLSSANRLNILQWKSVSGIITPDDKISSMLLTAYNDNGITYVSTLAGIVCLLGCSMADGTQWSEYYAIDNILFDLKNDVTSMFINGANDNTIRLTFDQNGVSRLINTVNTTTRNDISKGCVSQFAASKDDSGALVGVGTWNYIPFNEWKKDNTDNFKARIYDGASVIIETTKFMLQVVLNIQLD